jgi:putative membrane protein (TIGR04086 family)
MQQMPNEARTPPPRIEPTGFFTGVQLRPVIIGIVVDFLATHLAMAAFVVGYVAKEVSKKGEVTDEAIARYMESPEGLTALLVIFCLGTALGGLTAAWRAGTLHVKHGAFVGLGSLLVSSVQQAMQESALQAPEWFNFISIVAVIPAGALGGYVAELLGQRRGSPQPQRPVP